MSTTYLEFDGFRVDLGDNYLDIDERPSRSGRILNIVQIDPFAGRVQGQVIVPARLRGGRAGRKQKPGRRVWVSLATLRKYFTRIEG